MTSPSDPIDIDAILLGDHGPECPDDPFGVTCGQVSALIAEVRRLRSQPALETAREQPERALTAWNTDREAFVMFHVLAGAEGHSNPNSGTGGEAVQACDHTICRFFTARQQSYDERRAFLSSQETPASLEGTATGGEGR